jgi:hypothetical protein
MFYRARNALEAPKNDTAWSKLERMDFPIAFDAPVLLGFAPMSL